MLAWRYLRARRAEGFISLATWFAVIGITLGVATLILVTSLMNGIRDEMTSRFIGIDGDVTVYKHLGEMYGMINGLVGTLKREQDRMVRLEEELEASMGAGLRTKIMGTVIDLQGEVDILRNLIQPPSSL